MKDEMDYLVDLCPPLVPRFKAKCSFFSAANKDCFLLWCHQL